MTGAKQLRKDFLIDITHHQQTSIMISSVVITLFSSIIYLFLGNILFTQERERGLKEYLVLTHIGWSIILLCLIGYIIKKLVKKLQVTVIYFQIVAMLCYLSYLSWGIYVTVCTTHDGRFSLTVWLIVLSLLVLFIDIPLPYFIFVMILNYVAISIVILNHNDTIHIIGNEFENQLFFALILTFAYGIRYTTALRNFKHKQNAISGEKTRKLFSASMNHELRSPLNGIIGNLQILESDTSISSESKEILKHITDSAENMTQLVNDLLDFSRLEAGEFKIIKKDFDLMQMRDRLNTMFYPQAAAKNLSFSITMDSSTPSIIHGDEMRIQQIIINLITNGIKYTSEGGVAVEFSAADNKLQIYVKDTGQGMAKETREALFSPYKRIDEEGNKHIQGTGLGMFIVSKLLEQMNGKISVDSALGHGTAYTVQIPVEIRGYNSGVRNSYANVQKEINRITQETSLKGVRVLAIDDSDMNLVVLNGLLKQEEVIFTQALSGAEALSLLEENSYDVLLLDHMMPDMDGLECLETIRKSNKNYANIPVVMLTGTGGVAETFIGAGANGYLVKPVKKDELIATIQKSVHSTI